LIIKWVNYAGHARIRVTRKSRNDEFELSKSAFARRSRQNSSVVETNCCVSKRLSSVACCRL
jgi:hypothetical protein